MVNLNANKGVLILRNILFDNQRSLYVQVMRERLLLGYLEFNDTAWTMTVHISLTLLLCPGVGLALSKGQHGGVFYGIEHGGDLRGMVQSVGQTLH